MIDTQQEKYRKRLLELDKRLGGEIENIEQEIVAAGMPVGETDPHARASKEAEVTIGRNEEGLQRLVQAALQRLEIGKFGICDDCNSKIAKARLDALPYAPVCIQCEKRRETS